MTKCKAGYIIVELAKIFSKLYKSITIENTSKNTLGKINYSKPIVKKVN